MNKRGMDISPKKIKSKESKPLGLAKEKSDKFTEALGANKKEDKINDQKKMTSKKKFWRDWSKKQKGIFLTVVIVVAALAAFLIYWFGFAQTEDVKDEVTKEEAVIDDGPRDVSPLTGLKVPEASAEQTPMAVVIENLSTVRPQSGLSEADVVYEFLAEGGITRFLVVFASNDVVEPDLVGPVRSLRSYFVPVGLELLAPVYHVGGAPNALERASSWGMRDVNQFFDSQYFWRDSSVNGQGAPHNMWSRMPELKYAVRDHGWPMDDGLRLRAWKFTDEAEAGARGDISKINIPFSSGSYNVNWEYDKDKNQYLRFQADEPHMDSNNDNQLLARNIVVQYCDTSVLAGDDKGRLEIKNDEGEGDALVFFNGEVVEATWKKDNRDSRTIFYERGTDTEIEFVPGQFWVEVVPTDKEVTWE